MDRRHFKARQDWDQLRANFSWNIPQYFNIAQACCDDWARVAPDRLAVTHINADNSLRHVTYGDLRAASNALANAFLARGLVRGDRCAVLLPQSPEVLITHFACHKLAMISLPLFTLFGEDALEYRLRDSGARVVVTDREKNQFISRIFGRFN